jgi:hypothetical protein
MVKKIIILLKGFLARFSARVDCRGRKVLFVEEIVLRIKETK